MEQYKSVHILLIVSITETSAQLYYSGTTIRHLQWHTVLPKNNSNYLKWHEQASCANCKFINTKYFT